MVWVGFRGMGIVGGATVTGSFLGGTIVEKGSRGGVGKEDESVVQRNEVDEGAQMQVALDFLFYTFHENIGRWAFKGNRRQDKHLDSHEKG